MKETVLFPGGCEEEGKKDKRVMRDEKKAKVMRQKEREGEESDGRWGLQARFTQTLVLSLFLWEWREHYRGERQFLSKAASLA